MAILIPDMEMPSGCNLCRLNNDTICMLINGCIYDETNGSTRRPDCPLVEVKTPRSPMSDKDLEACNFEL